MKDILNVNESFSHFKKRMKKELAEKTEMQEQMFYYASCMKQPIQEHTILFKSNNGSSMEGDPKVIFDYMLQEKKYEKYQFVWVMKNEKLKKMFEDKFIDAQNVQFIDMKLDEYLQWLATSKYLISDNRLPVYFIKREQQVYVQTDTRFINFKQVYRQTESNVNEFRMRVKDLLSSSILFSPSAYYTENIIKRDFKLSNIFEGSVMETISPRHQEIRNSNQLHAKKKCECFGLNPYKKQILLVFGKPVLFYEKVQFCKRLEQIIPSHFQICVKTSASEYAKIKRKMKSTKILVINNRANMNSWLAAADYLVGDGAGYTFDFLATARMIIFTDLYGIIQGQVYSENELPGPTAHTPEDVVSYIENENEYRAKFLETYSTFVSRYIFSGINERWKELFAHGEINANIGQKIEQNKEKLLVVAPLKQLLSEEKEQWYFDFYQLLSRFDYDKYDVTVVSNRPVTYQEEANIQKRMDMRVRFLYRTGYLVQSEEKYMEYKYLTKYLFDSDDIEKVLSFADQEECKNDWIRVCGTVLFDRVIYFGPPLAGFYILIHFLDVKEKIYCNQENYKELFSSKFISKSSKGIPIVSEKKDKVVYEDTIYHVKEEIIYEDGQLDLIMSNTNP